MAKTLKIGTRRSLLAWAQSGWVARELERLNPGVRVELVGIDTRGDKIQDVPLTAVQGKEFFVAELDEALRAGEVDLSVHSGKDLSLERPPEFTLAATPRRENPRDVVLFSPQVMQRLAAGRPLRIGTSSPRRLENIPPLLERLLPQVRGHAPRVEMIEIRGNVNTRLGRVHEPDGSARQLDGVVLAFAGLIRLWRDDTARVELARLLTGVRWMVLPLRECPAAPAQGALAVECRADDAETLAIASRLHDAPSASRVARERALLEAWGGGCHQRFGATAVVGIEVGELFYIRGRKPDGVAVDELQWSPAAPRPGASVRGWDGSRWRAASRPLPSSMPVLAPGDGLFIAHSRALPASWADGIAPARIWTSGLASWSRLAAQGVWVEGCAEGLGFADLEITLAEPVLGLPGTGHWRILTHDRAGWAQGQVTATYRLDESLPAEAAAELREATHAFWASGSQFAQMKHALSAGLAHACGAGKTAAELRAQGIEPLVFPSPEEWRQWLT